jgi:dipeptidyl aminopeptidase/acylaminoacyl peptidase
MRRAVAGSALIATTVAVCLSHGMARAEVRTSDVTLERWLGAPSPGDILAAPVGHAVGWVVSDRGRRNIWVATGEPLRARALTAFAQDDGQPIQELTWAPDASAIAFVRGAGAGASGEPLNPSSAVAGTSQDVWVVSLDGGTARRVGPGRAPAISARGQLVYVHDDGVWVAPIGGGEAVRLFAAHGQVSDLQWSPDGASLAFSTRRGVHGLIGIYHVGHASLEYVSPSVDRDLYPRWSRDGRRLAFVRFENVEAALRSSGRWGPIDSPWALEVVERQASAFGPAREVWRAPAGPIGSFPRNVQILRWVDGDRLVFASEHEDWAHLYLADPAMPGSALVELTPGACEVDDAATAVDGGTVFFSSNCGDPERRHLWSVAIPARGAPMKAPRALTSGDSVETSPAPTADGKTLVFLAADARTPTRPRSLSLASGAVAPLTDDAPFLVAATLVDPERATIKAADGLEIHGALFAPASRPGAPRRAALVHVHGGPTAGQDLRGWNPFFQYLVSRGYVVLGLNYRGGAGYGRAFREIPKQGMGGAVEYQDVVAAAEYLRSRPDVDPARIGIFGTSYGGYLTQLALARNSGLFAAGVTECGIFDLANNPRGTSRAGEAGRVARESSAVGAIDKWRSPVLIIHGDDDPGVDFDRQTIALVKALRARRVPFEHLVFPDEGHGSSVWAHSVRARQATADFFDRQLALPSRPTATSPKPD